MFGSQAEVALDTKYFTLDAIMEGGGNTTHHDNLIRLFEGYIAKKISVVLRLQAHRPPELQDWKCPRSGDYEDLIRGEYEPITADIVMHEPMHFDSSSSKGTAQTLFQLVQNLRLDVLNIAKDLSVNANDASAQIIAGDLASVQGQFSIEPMLN